MTWKVRWQIYVLKKYPKKLTNTITINTVLLANLCQQNLSFNENEMIRCLTGILYQLILLIFTHRQGLKNVIYILFCSLSSNSVIIIQQYGSEYKKNQKLYCWNKSPISYPLILSLVWIYCIWYVWFCLGSIDKRNTCRINLSWKINVSKFWLWSRLQG